MLPFGWESGARSDVLSNAMTTTTKDHICITPRLAVLHRGERREEKVLFRTTRTIHARMHRARDNGEFANKDHLFSPLAFAHLIPA